MKEIRFRIVPNVGSDSILYEVYEDTYDEHSASPSTEHIGTKPTRKEAIELAQARAATFEDQEGVVVTEVPK